MKIIYGKFYQDRTEKDPIEWIPMLKISNTKNNSSILYLLSKRILITSNLIEDWHNSTINKYLNSFFLENAFSETEKQLLIEHSCIDDIKLVSVPTIQKCSELDQHGNYLMLKNIRETNTTKYARNFNDVTKPTEHIVLMRTIYFEKNTTWISIDAKSKRNFVFYAETKYFGYDPMDLSMTPRNALFGIRPCICLNTNDVPNLNEYNGLYYTQYI